MHRVARQPLAILAVLAILGASAGCAASAPARDPASCYACDELGGDEITGRREDGKPVNEVCSEQENFSDLPAFPSSCASPPPSPSPSNSRFATTRIGAGTDPTEAHIGARPPRALKVDIGFNHASFQDAARLLAEAGRFAIVLEDLSASEVDTRLRDVEPFEALALLAQARGLDVTYERGVVVVSRRSATASTRPGNLP